MTTPCPCDHYQRWLAAEAVNDALHDRVEQANARYETALRDGLRVAHKLDTAHVRIDRLRRAVAAERANVRQAQAEAWDHCRYVTDHEDFMAEDFVQTPNPYRAAALAQPEPPAAAELCPVCGKDCGHDVRRWLPDRYPTAEES